jgi:hypothetical protein
VEGSGDGGLFWRVLWVVGVLDGSLNRRVDVGSSCGSCILWLD